MSTPTNLSLVTANKSTDDETATADSEAAAQAQWLSSEFGESKLPFDDLVDAMVLFVEVHDIEPDTLYVHPETQFWLSFRWSNFDLDGAPEPQAFWVDLTELHSASSVKIIADPAVPPGWWHLVRTVERDTDLIPWTS